MNRSLLGYRVVFSYARRITDWLRAVCVFRSRNCLQVCSLAGTSIARTWRRFIITPLRSFHHRFKWWRWAFHLAYSFVVRRQNKVNITGVRSNDGNSVIVAVSSAPERIASESPTTVKSPKANQRCQQHDQSTKGWTSGRNHNLSFCPVHYHALEMMS